MADTQQGPEVININLSRDTLLENESRILGSRIVFVPEMAQHLFILKSDRIYISNDYRKPSDKIYRANFSLVISEN